jgi:hypothetical protein
MLRDPSTVMCGMEAILAEFVLGFVSFQVCFRIILFIDVSGVGSGEINLMRVR